MTNRKRITQQDVQDKFEQHKTDRPVYYNAITHHRNSNGQEMAFDNRKEAAWLQTERFWVSEIIREKVIHQSYQEIPYSTAVTIEEFKEHPEKNLVVIKATVHVERDSQKKILIGKGGQKLKKIGEAARKEAEVLLGTRIFLELWVNVEKNWTQDPRALNRLGYPSTLDHSL